jgi:hypothetical protein
VTAGGIVNMEVVASAGGAMDTYSFSRQLVTDHAGRRVLAALSDEPQMAPQAANLPLSTKCGKRGQPYCQCPKGGFPDHVVFKKNLGEKSVIVGALYSRVRDITAEFSYKQGQSSSLGVAFSIGTADGSYSQAGTHSVSSSSGEDFPNFHGHTAHLYRTYFRYGKYRWRCDTAVNGVTKQVWGAWQVQANDFGGGASSPRLHQAPDAKFCVPQEAHSTFHKSTSVAYTFTRGANISSNIGIDLSSRTGYDREASISYVVGSSGRLICGLKGPPGGSNPAPRLIVAGAK